MEPVRIDSFCQFRFVSNPGFSPDGRYIAFVVRQADLKSNSYPGNLYFYDTEKDSYSQLQVLRRMEACGYYSREEAETVAETAALAFAN